MISNAPELDALVQQVIPVERIALDTEADSLHVYREKLCLIQVSLPTEVHALVDPLADFSLRPFYDAMVGKIIVLHGADYDLRLMRRAGGFVATAIFDTMLAARLIGRREFSYAALVQSECGIALTKGSQKANWARRPLTSAMAEYAQNDTRHLLFIADRLAEKLRELGRWQWFEQCCARALAQAAIDRERDAADAWRISGSGALRGKAAAMLRELWQWREEEAAKVDRPTFHVLRNEELLGAARMFAAGDMPSFDHLRGPRRHRFYDAAHRVNESDESSWPVFQKRVQSRWTAVEEKRFESLRKVRDEKAVQLDLDPSMLAPRATLETLAANPDAVADSLLPWQRELLAL